MTEKKELSGDLQLFQGASVLCIGDVMLDRFVYGAVDRISPEAPIPVLRVEREKHMLGGAGNVAANIAALGGKAVLISVAGQDNAGQEIEGLLAAAGMTSGLLRLPQRMTTVKSRFIGGTQQMIRVDREQSDAIDAAAEQEILSRVEEYISRAGAVILSDYGKGLLTEAVINGVIALAKKAGKPVIVDPKGVDFSKYKGASVITPNRKELETATGMKAAQDDEVRAAAMKLILTCGVDAVLATRSAQGMTLIQQDAPPLHIPAQVRDIYDVSGAGDTVIATFALAVAAGVVFEKAALLSNIAAGIVVGKPGTATTRIEEIEQSLGEETVSGASGNKLATLQQALEQTERLRARGRSIGFTNGCFDLLHPGHLSTLRQAKAACDFLIVAINSDESVRKLKGASRPVQDEAARAAVLSAMADVDMVLVFGDDTPIELIRALRPDVLVKGGQYKIEEVVGYDVVSAYGGRIVRADMADGFSTTNTVNRFMQKTGS